MTPSWFMAVAEKPVYVVVDDGKARIKRRPEVLGQGRLRDRGRDQRCGRRGFRGRHHRPGRGATGPLCEHPDPEEVLPRPMRSGGGDGIQDAQGDRGPGIPELPGSRPGGDQPPEQGDQPAGGRTRRGPAGVPPVQDGWARPVATELFAPQGNLPIKNYSAGRLSERREKPPRHRTTSRS